ncbi:uncharacterized protein [Salminus brasiliensis]|uniref:uncharacterized protein isoform X2 n=1 Tax=Salminus brasiliensis TaxID=930266 RepID=UPI003B832761
MQYLGAQDVYGVRKFLTGCAEIISMLKYCSFFRKADMNMDDFENSTFPAFLNGPISDSLQCPFTMWSIFNVILVTIEWTLVLLCVPWALWFQMTQIRLTLENELFVFNLLCMDLVSIPIIITFCLNMYMWKSSIMNHFGWFLFLLYLHSHSLLQCCVSAERYLAVVYPVTFLKFKPVRYKGVCLCLVWLVTLALGSAHYYTEDSNVLLLNFLFVILSMTYCSLSILKVLKCHSPGDGKGKKESEGEGGKLIKKRAFIIVSILQAKVLVNYLPTILIMTFKDMFPQIFYECVVFFIAVNIGCLGNFIHSVLYLQRVVKFPFV